MSLCLVKIINPFPGFFDFISLIHNIFRTMFLGYESEKSFSLRMELLILYRHHS